MRVVFDTNSVISALLFRGALSWLVDHWRSPGVTPLVCRESAQELVRVLAYAKFGLSTAQVDVALAHYLPYFDRIALPPDDGAPPRCRDTADQAFLRLVSAGLADILVTGDPDLLALKEVVPFVIETPSDYRRRCLGIPSQ